MNTVKMLKAYAREFSSGACNRIPAEMVYSVMAANNRILAAAIIENGGRLVISPDSIHAMLGNTGHVIAQAAQDGSLTLHLASKEEILSKPEAMAL